MISIVLVDDQASVRQGLQMLFALEPDLKVVAEAEDGETALSLVPELKPDVVLMDLAMPHLDGLAATRQLSKLCPNTAVVVLSLHGDAHTRSEARQAGADAFVDKHEDTDILLATIRTVANRTDYSSKDTQPQCAKEGK